MKTRYLYFCLTLSTMVTAQTSWQSIIASYDSLLTNTEKQILQAHYEQFTLQQLPKIADQVIKNIAICENNEPCIDLKLQSEPRIIMMPDPSYPFESPNNNSGFASACKMRTSIYEKLIKMIQVLDSLASEFGYKPGSIIIKIFEGLRDIKTQQYLFDQQCQKIAIAYPDWTDDQIFIEACKWVSPVINNIPVHSTGAAIDLRLFDQDTDSYIDMGPFGVIWNANPQAPTFSQGLTELQMKNRLLLYIAALKVGLIAYPYEFWHFSHGDRYATYWQPFNTHVALYGTVLEH